MIFKLVGAYDEHRYSPILNLNYPQIFIFITENLSIFGSYCSNYKISGGWVTAQNSFLFSINLNKKYPAKITKNNYCAKDDVYDFRDIKFYNLYARKGEFDKTGTYLDKY